jgi:hypothetical protein
MIKVSSNNNHRYPLIYQIFTCNQKSKISRIHLKKSTGPKNHKMLLKGPFDIWELPKPRTVYKRPTNVPKFFRVWVFGKNGFLGEAKSELGGRCFWASIVGRDFFFFFFFS